MFRNILVKALAAAAFAVVGVGVAGTVNSSNTTVQASAFHYLRKDHKLVTLGFGEKLPLRFYYKGKHFKGEGDENYTSDSIGSSYFLLKTHGWKYINGTKYYKIYSYFDNLEDGKYYSAYVPTKYFTNKYNDLSYLAIYCVTHKIKALSDDMQNTDMGDWYGKGDIIMLNKYSIWNHNKYVDTISPMQDGKHNKDGFFSYTGVTVGGELKPSDFKKYCRKAGPNTKYVVSEDGKSYYTNASLARGGMYVDGKFYKIYSR